MKRNLSYLELSELSIACHFAYRYHERAHSARYPSDYNAKRALELRELSWFYHDLRDLSLSHSHYWKKGR